MNVDLLLASGGVIVVDPPSGPPRKFEYSGVGIGLSIPILKWLKLQKLELPKISIRGHGIGGSGSAKGFDSNGTVYMTETFHGDELEAQNFEGGIIYLDWSAGYLAGWSGSYLLAGINLELMKAAMVPWAGGTFLRQAIMSAPVFIKTQGRMEGLTDSIGAGLMFGQIHYQGAEAD
ncbi:hypothetical protein GXB81_09215 [Paraburkholderia sp. Ac-20336]|nr:hypothetical protein [Paraburkholderia sp. Ac-20336]